MRAMTRRSFAPEPATERLERLESVVALLDTAWRIPGTRVRFGVDAIIGLVPGLGDLVGGMVSALVIAEAIRSGAPALVVARMFLTLGADVVLGAVPVAGDLFDLFWKAGHRNLALLRRYHDHPDRTVRGTRRGLLVLALGVGMLAAAAMALAIEAVGAILGMITGG